MSAGTRSDNRRALAAIESSLDAVTRDWGAYQRQAVEFHIRDAKAWAGEDLVAQIDPDFVPRPDAASGRPVELVSRP
ncbi:hypothetical protein ACIBG0_20535 [Nocardia sp. NPDC050630]|uniref:hypothetical protein n=1 Tax=Nocardia sp. NPDC050630 TaxID=3364321 RepID=UPI003799B179